MVLIQIYADEKILVTKFCRNIKSHFKSYERVSQMISGYSGFYYQININLEKKFRRSVLGYTWKLLWNGLTKLVIELLSVDNSALTTFAMQKLISTIFYFELIETLLKNFGCEPKIPISILKMCLKTHLIFLFR